MPTSSSVGASSTTSSVAPTGLYVCVHLYRLCLHHQSCIIIVQSDLNYIRHDEINANQYISHMYPHKRHQKQRLQITLQMRTYICMLLSKYALCINNKI